MEIKQEQDQRKGTFNVEEEGLRLAKLEYSMANEKLMVINNTEVDELLKGKNIGNQLVNMAADFARTNFYKIFPLCPFANAVMKKKSSIC